MPSTQRGRVGTGQGVDTHRCAHPESVPNTHPNDTSTAEIQSVRHPQENGNAESTSDAVTRICTHRCAHYPMLKMSPESCSRRMAKVRSKPVVVGPTIAWECVDCSGPIPLNGDVHKPDLPKLTEHDMRYMRTRAFKCCKCGTEDIDQFDKGHSRKCRDCVEISRKAKAELRKVRRSGKIDANQRRVCACGRKINVNEKAIHRVRAGMCGLCWRKFMEGM